MTGPPRRNAVRCPRCGAPYEPLQEYCLECGERLPATQGVVGALSAAWRRRFRRYPGDWIWPVLLLLLLAAASTALALAASAARQASTPRLAVETDAPVTLGTAAPPTTAAAGTAAQTESTAPRPTIATGTLPVAPGEPSTATPTTTAPPPTTAPAATGPIPWPTGTSGYTVVLESIPTSAGRGIAVRRARAAVSADLPEVGILRSSGFASLHPGYWVVFTGVYGSRAEAEDALPTARAEGFPDAYPTRVTS